jgi:hypothetical protein
MMTDDISTKAFEKIGGLPSLVKWIKESARNRSAFYSWYIPSRLRQPLVQTNVNVNVINEEVVRAKLQDALLRQIEARRFDSVDPVVTVNGERIIDHQVLGADPRLEMGERVSDTPLSSSSVTANESPSADEPRPVTTDTRSQPPDARPRPVQFSVPGQGAGAALDGSDDNRSTTQKFLDWSGHGKLF